MVIGFTGHRDRLAAVKDLDRIRKQYPDAVWIHGGARGFDRQVSRYAQRRGIRQEALEPDYRKHGNAAPFVRNIAIVDRADFIVALYDGREGGGTLFTIEYARRQDKEVRLLRPTEQ
jgi:hypothetical protein